MVKWFTRSARQVQTTTAPVVDSAFVRTISVPVAGGVENRDLTYAQALYMDLVFRAAQIVAGHISQMGMQTLLKNKVVANSPIIEKPNADIPASLFYKQVAMSMLISGNAYLLLDRVSWDAPIDNIVLLNPLDVHIDTHTGRKVYRYTDSAKGVYEYQDWQVKHLVLTPFPGVAKGIGPIQAGAQLILGAVDLQAFGMNYIYTGDSPTGILTTDQVVDEKQVDVLQKRWFEGGKGTRRVRILGKGLTYQPIHANAKDAQFIESQQFTVTRIAALFGLPAGKLLAEVNGNSMTYTNQEQANIQYLQDTLSNYMTPIEDAMTEIANEDGAARSTARNPRRKVVCKFNEDVLLRTDKQTAFNQYGLLVDKAIITPEEARQILIDGGFINV